MTRPYLDKLLRKWWSTGDKSWYFYNPQLVEQGKMDFQRKWGRRKLEDNWRRRNKTVISSNESEDKNDNEEAVTKDKSVNVGEKAQTSLTDTVVTDNKNPDFYLQHIPLTEEAMKESNDILSDGLYNMGMIYKDKLEDYPLAQKTFSRLYTQFPSVVWMRFITIFI